MEILLRCAVPDRPGALAELAGVIGSTGADIEAVDVVDTSDGLALDDLVLVVRDPAHLRAIIGRIADLDGVEVIHATPSRGHPGDAVTRFAVALESMLNGAMELDRGLATLLSGLLHAEDVAITDERPPRERDGVLVVPLGARHVVVRRQYAFSRTERERALALVRVGTEAARAPIANR